MQNVSFVFVFVSCFGYYYLGYRVIKKIGEGTFSEVLKTQSLKDGKFYACKTMKQTINRYVSCSKRPAHRHHSLLCVWTLETWGSLSILLDGRLTYLWPCSDEVTIEVTARNVSWLCPFKSVQAFALLNCPHTGTLLCTCIMLVICWSYEILFHWSTSLQYNFCQVH